MGGCTVILSPLGEIRYVVSMNVLGAGRIGRRQEFLVSPIGKRYWSLRGKLFEARPDVFRLIHDAPTSAPAVL